MARVIYDPGIQVFSGGVGGFVYRQQQDGSLVVAKRPRTNPNRVPTDAQAAHLQRFKEASARYRRLMEDTGIKQAYEQIATERGCKSRLRSMVIGDILKPPEIQIVDLSHYNGAIGNTIRIVAHDNVGILYLTLSIYDNTNNMELESAEKDMSENISLDVEWLYTTTVRLPDESLHHDITLTVKVYDLAGNEIASSVSVAE